MNDLIRFTTVVLHGGRTPSAGSPSARGLALAARHYAGAFRLIGWLMAAVFTTCILINLTDVPNFIIPMLGMLSFQSGMIVSSRDSVSGSEDFALTLPVDRGEAFLWKFLPGLAVILTVSVVISLVATFDISSMLWSLVATGPLTESTPAWPANVALGVFFMPMLVYSAGFHISLSKVNAKSLRGLLSLMVVIGIFSTATAYSTSLNTGVDPRIECVLPIAVIIGLAAWAYRKETRPETNKWAPTLAAIRSYFLSTKINYGSARPDISEKPYRPLARFAGTPGSDAALRRALFQLTYAGKGTAIGITVVVWLLSVATVTIGIQIVMNMIFAMILGELVLAPRWKKAGGEEFMLLLPVKRSVVFFMRVAPALALTLGMGVFSVFCSVGLRLHEVNGSFSHPVRDTVNDWRIPVACLAGTLMFTAFSGLSMIWPKVIHYTALWFLLLGQLFANRENMPGPAETGFISIAILIGIILFAYTRFLKKELTPDAMAKI